MAFCKARMDRACRAWQWRGSEHAARQWAHARMHATISHATLARVRVRVKRDVLGTTAEINNLQCKYACIYLASKVSPQWQRRVCFCRKGVRHMKLQRSTGVLLFPTSLRAHLNIQSLTKILICIHDQFWIRHRTAESPPQSIP